MSEGVEEEKERREGARCGGSVEVRRQQATKRQLVVWWIACSLMLLGRRCVLQLL